ncbi:MAG: leucyl/phenylalanyl-tRNA--protein transferase [Woeseiaceae bacterium]|nr:leucyl/phenylalanyl-tRNA--protein transferase [Woeseiaceae bacterium]
MRSPQISWISADDPPDSFPDVEQAFDVPDGLLAAGGDLSTARLLSAYSHGIFPWYSDGQPILWWSPNPRCVIYPDRLHVSRRLKRSLRNSALEVSFNQAFKSVIDACAEDRRGQDGTWITAEMRDACLRLHKGGWAYSTEVWRGERLVGGLYGLAIGKIFFGESMFSAETNGSKAALIALTSVLLDNNIRLLDCQVESPHLRSMGAEMISRSRFSNELQRSCGTLNPFANWPEERSDICLFQR